MNLVIDIGNTQAKLGVFSNKELLFHKVFDVNSLEAVQKVLKNHPIQHAMICNVSKPHLPLNELLEAHVLVHYLRWDTQVPFHNEYQTPQKLGVDRMALVSGAIAMYPKQAVLVIDAGSCITYDFKTADEIYKGGAISPGIQMRYAALANQTQNLPHLKKQFPVMHSGTSTEASIHSGVIYGVCSEINGFIDHYRQQSENLTVILTGGDADFLSKTIKNSIFAHSDLLLTGLQTILELNSTE